MARGLPWEAPAFSGHRWSCVRTLVYVDGFNLYYGSLKCGGWKWLDLVQVLRTEEKGSDVNLAVHLLNDAWLDKYDCAVVVSNDSDVAEGMRLAKEHVGKRIGLVTPGKRRTSQVLRGVADFTRHVRLQALRDSQLPNPIPGTNLRKPMSWQV